MSEPMPETPATDPPASELLRRLEKRAYRLRLEAYCFLGMIVLLLIFGAVVFYQAPQLTSRDVRGNSENRLSATYDEIARLNKRNSEINTALSSVGKTCNVYADFFKQWVDQNLQQPDDHAFHLVSFETNRLPNGKEIADRITRVLSSDDLGGLKNVGVQIAFPVPCGGKDIFLIQPRESYSGIAAAVAGHEFPIDIGQADSLDTELAKNAQRIAFLQQVAAILYGNEVVAAANGASSTEGAASSDDDKTQIIRLVQTSITRFGALIVVSFLVTILIPSYRYNVRLATFYAARADALVAMRPPSIEGDPFGMLTAILTPHIEFGKSPSTPVEQIADLIRAVRGAEAGTQSKEG